VIRNSPTMVALLLYITSSVSRGSSWNTGHQGLVLREREWIDELRHEEPPWRTFTCVNRTAHQFVREDANDSLDRLETKGCREVPRRCTRETSEGRSSARGVKDAAPKGNVDLLPQ
jgi:hypothetical protein